ncbi:DsrE family protein [candidate division KSB1 bacterium]
MTFRFRSIVFSILVILIILGGFNMTSAQVKENEPEKLVVVWTSGDKEVANDMVFMYAHNAKKRGWWKDVTMIIWGPSQKLAAEDEEIQKQLTAMKESGITIEVCKACADRYGVAEELTECGFSVEYMGVPLTNYMKDPNVKVVSF